MVLYPLDTPAQADQSPISVWDAIERQEKARAREWWAVAQPDHAVLAGDLAACVVRGLPRADDEVVRAIALHDEGWAEFDAQVDAVDGRPLSFLDFTPAKFLIAWRGSIVRAEESSPLAGVLVSEHFVRLGQLGIEIDRYRDPQDVARIREFLREESERQERLRRSIPRSPEEIAALVDLLQFCDLLSLYLCCGSQAAVEFPQRADGRPIRLFREHELCRLEPAIFGSGMSLEVRARHFPPRADATSSIAFLLS
jgi:hypothetical protein